MALPTSGNPISMSQMRTEFDITGAISMSDLYRGGGEVPATATTTVSGSIPNLTGSQNGYGGSSNPYLNHYYSVASRFTGNMTCGNDGNVTADGDITFTTVATASGDNAENMQFVNSGQVNTGGVRICTTDATGTGNNLQNGILNSGTSPIVFKSFSGTQTAASLTGGTYVTTIPDGTSFNIPQGTTSFRMFTHASGRKRMKGDNSGFCTVNVGAGSGSFTSTNTSNVNTSVPSGGVGDTEFQFSDLFGATA
jgi:hypothetical protein|tara:strand:- start:453 stop:1208 length:756 start_codon:yes stop_codon:yes gene_type:complete